ncbi:MAG: hypothetical protein AAGU19_17670 [Prolixibacteraceae bacterium]
MAYLLKILLYILLAYYVFRFVGRGLKSLFGESEEERRPPSGRPRRPEGDVRLERDPRQDPRIRRDEGEYVDFEEID